MINKLKSMTHTILKPSVDKNINKKLALRILLLSLSGNLFLSIIKLLAGIIAHSGALISDAVHSASDLFSTVAVIIGINISSKEADEKHPYGHERLECVTAIAMATILAVTGLAIGYFAIEKIISSTAQQLQAPGMLALIAAVISILIKEGL